MTVDAGKVEGDIPATLYGQFLKYMFQCIKFGLHGELILNRSFEEAPDALGLSRHWDPYPDDRNDVGLNFASDRTVSYPGRPNPESGNGERSLRVDVNEWPTTRRGICQRGIPVRNGHVYDGYVWIKSSAFNGRVRVELESEIEGRKPYAEAALEGVHDDWAQHRFSLRSDVDDPARDWRSSSRDGAASARPGLAHAPGRRGRRPSRRLLRTGFTLKPAFIRWPGGNVAQDYHWQWGVDPRDSRAVWTNCRGRTRWSRAISAPMSIYGSARTRQPDPPS